MGMFHAVHANGRLDMYFFPPPGGALSFGVLDGGLSSNPEHRPAPRKDARFAASLLSCRLYLCGMSDMKSPMFLHPGPVTVPPFVLDAIGKPLVHHRTAAFESFFEKFQEDLRYVFQTSEPVIAMPGSGTFGMEAAIFSVFKPGDQVAIPAMGKFSQRWAAFGISLGLDVVPLGVAWGHCITLENVRQVLSEYPNLKGWVLTHVETSTGMAIDLEEIAFAIKQDAPDQLIVVDAICSVGIQIVYTDAWQLDVVVAASQKGLSNPAGTVYVAVSPLAVKCLVYPEAADYRCLGHYHRYLMHGSYPFTPPLQLFYGVKAALERIRAESLPVVWNRTHEMSRYFKSEVQGIGGIIFGEGNADALTVFGFGRRSHEAIREMLVRDHGIELGDGQDQLHDLVIRVGHFGEASVQRMEGCIAALEKIVKEIAK
jgi:serine---pyruvate transaminase